MTSEKIIPHVKGVITQFDIGDNDLHFAIDVKDQFGHSRTIFVKEAERNIFGKMTSINKMELKDLFTDPNIRKYAWDDSTEFLLENTQ